MRHLRYWREATIMFLGAMLCTGCFWSWKLGRIDTSVLIAAIATVSAFISAAYAWVQSVYTRRQLELSSLIEIVSINRELIMAALTNPNLEDALDVLPGDGATVRKRGCQLWLNQFHLVWTAHKLGLTAPDEWEAQRCDMQDALRKLPMRAHWERVQKYYEKGFNRFVNASLAVPPQPATTIPLDVDAPPNQGEADEEPVR